MINNTFPTFTNTYLKSSCYKTTSFEQQNKIQQYPSLYFQKNTHFNIGNHIPSSSFTSNKIPIFNSQKYISTHIPQNRNSQRNTLPLDLNSLVRPTDHSLSCTSIRNTVGAYRKISFSYKSPANKRIQAINQAERYLPNTSKNKQYSKNFQILKKQSKRRKNKLDSSVFSITYSFKQQDYENRYSRSSQCNSLFQLVNISLIKNEQRNQKWNKYGNQSQIASTIATQSYLNQSNRKSDFNSSNTFKYRSFNSKVSNMIQRDDLIDHIPIHKQLRQTVMIPYKDYSFGGIIEQQQKDNHKQIVDQIKKSNINYQINSRHWNSNVKFLIDIKQGDKDQNLKQSIHIGPEIRAQQHKFELLRNFGRQLKTSTLSISD